MAFSDVTEDIMEKGHVVVEQGHEDSAIIRSSETTDQTSKTTLNRTKEQMPRVKGSYLQYLDKYQRMLTTTSKSTRPSDQIQPMGEIQLKVN